MKLSYDSRNAIVNELKYVADGLSQEVEVIRKVYIYSAAYAMVNRILNVEFSSELVLAHTILQSSYTQINGTFNNIMTGTEKVITFPENMFEFLAKSLKDLADAISEDRDLTKELQKIAMVGYAATGNGYYLCQKGILKLVDTK